MTKIGRPPGHKKLTPGQKRSAIDALMSGKTMRNVARAAQVSVPTLRRHMLDESEHGLKQTFNRACVAAGIGIQDCVDTLAEAMMNASTRIWDSESKSFIEVPDYRTRATIAIQMLRLRGVDAHDSKGEKDRIPISLNSNLYKSGETVQEAQIVDEDEGKDEKGTMENDDYVMTLPVRKE